MLRIRCAGDLALRFSRTRGPLNADFAVRYGLPETLAHAVLASLAAADVII